MAYTVEGIRTAVQSHLPVIAAESAQLDVERRLSGSATLASSVAALKAAGLGALRVPVQYGGAGGTVRELAEAISTVAEADSNLTQIFRGHWGFVEFLLQSPSSEVRDRLLREAGSGKLFGPAASERDSSPLLALKTSLTERDGKVCLNGVKYYTTGSLHSEWINVLVIDESRGGILEVVVPRDAEGITVVDDWNGFGQVLTASGTTSFVDVDVDAALVLPYHDPLLIEALQAFYQFVHSATLAGIASRAVAEAAEAVSARTRSYPNAVTQSPTEDPQVLEVVGRASAQAFAVKGAVLALSDLLDEYFSPDSRQESSLTAAIVASAQVQVFSAGELSSLTWRIFDALSASALAVPRALDRHWRNARTVSSHNPSPYKARTVGNFLVNGELSPTL